MNFMTFSINNITLWWVNEIPKYRVKGRTLARFNPRSTKLPHLMSNIGSATDTLLIKVYKKGDPCCRELVYYFSIVSFTVSSKS